MRNALCEALSVVALVTSMLGLFGVTIAAVPGLLTPGVVLACLGPAGVLLGIVGCCWKHNGKAIAAIILGSVVSLYLPTLLLPFLARPENGCVELLLRLT